MDLQLENHDIRVLRDAIIYAESIKDFVSKDLFSAILGSETEHLEWIKTQPELIDKIRKQNYLLSQT